ncbi:hypothetical protein HZB03_04055 [Candidatus Woesearchaeota archaeon]|nr:hypothetical protein [Candidatus Woesearchaeota archaeon]
MVKAQARLKVADKWKRKKWFYLIAPKIFGEQVVGETPANSPEAVRGRTVEVNLMMLTGNIKTQNINVTFEVMNVQGANAYTEVKRFELQQASIKRRVRRRKDKLDDSFVCVTKDKKVIRLKPLIITNSKTSQTMKARLRRTTMANLQHSISTVDYDTLIIDLVNYKLQKDIRNMLHKTFPVKAFEIRILETMKDEKHKLASLLANAAMMKAPPEARVEIEEETSQAPQEQELPQEHLETQEA